LIRAQNIASRNIAFQQFLCDSAGYFCPCRKQFSPDTDDFGRVSQKRGMSARAFRQSPPHHGYVRGRRADALTVMCDHIRDDRRLRSLSAGPALVHAAIGRKTSAEDLGGAKMAFSN